MAKRKETAWRALGLATNLGITMAAAIAVGYYMGLYLDKWIFHRDNFVFTVIFALCGVGAGFRSVFRMINDIYRDDKDGGKE